MSNLVPLHIDKDTGELVATKRSIGGGAGADGYVHDQLTPDTSWTINHLYGSSLLICQIYSTTGELIFADSVTIVDDNTVQVEFGAPQDGRAHLMFFETV